ncbi:MAG TPA: DNA recombination protein RmuC [Candidatus Paceibacterota bacterium]|nr:DNA recombination protein RmuC [Candidatus Paceibacterota bacterium]
MNGLQILELIGGMVMVLVLVGVFVIVFLREKKSESKRQGNDFLLLQNQLNDLRQMLDAKLSDSHSRMERRMDTQLSESSKIIREVTAHLTKLDETNRQVVGFADQLQSLQDILRNPKQRGTLGEYYLETVLKNVLPPSGYQMQYHFENGEAVDAVIFLDRGKVLPIDSKFSLENYNKLLETSDPSERARLEKAFRQDIINRVNETAKYIRTREKTMDFAFMFIPSEAIYYDLLVNRIGGRDLIEYAFQKKQVVVVSPTSFMAYLQTVLQGLRSLQIEESAKEIRKHVENLGKHLKVYDDSMTRLGNTLGTTVRHYDSARREWQKMDRDILKITGTSPELSPSEELPKPGQREKELEEEVESVKVSALL